MLVLAGGIAGLNVFLVLLAGIVSGAAITLATGTTAPLELLGSMGAGASGMFETILVTILVSAMCGLIREYGIPVRGGEAGGGERKGVGKTF